MHRKNHTINPKNRIKMNIKEKIKQIESDDNTNDEHVLHQLLELAMAVTGRGDVSDDYTKFIEFDKTIKIVREQIASDIFDSPLKEINDEKKKDRIFNSQ